VISLENAAVCRHAATLAGSFTEVSFCFFGDRTGGFGSLGGILFTFFATKGECHSNANTHPDTDTNSYVVHRYAQRCPGANAHTDADRQRLSE
jgi:hypothetical protein